MLIACCLLWIDYGRNWSSLTLDSWRQLLYPSPSPASSVLTEHNLIPVWRRCHAVPGMSWDAWPEWRLRDKNKCELMYKLPQHVIGEAFWSVLALFLFCIKWLFREKEREIFKQIKLKYRGNAWQSAQRLIQEPDLSVLQSRPSASHPDAKGNLFMRFAGL